MRKFSVRQEQKLGFFEYFRGTDLPVPEPYKEPTWETIETITRPGYTSMLISKTHYYEADFSDEDFVALKLKFGIKEITDKNQTQEDTQAIEYN
jgi:hypothetical protein